MRQAHARVLAIKFLHGHQTLSRTRETFKSTTFRCAPFGRLWYGEPDAVSNAIGFAEFYSRSHDAVICVYDDAAT